jgi:predicted nucleotidyltransferase
VRRVDERIAKELSEALGSKLRRCRAAILFGSRASGDESQGSDWDVLLVSDEPDRAPDCRRASFDVVRVSTRSIESVAWRNSELASHVQCYGKWIWGESEWPEPSDLQAAACHKADRLHRKVASFLKLGPHLSSPHRARHLTRLAWDFQRFAFLADGRPVPSTLVVARTWDALESDARQTLIESVIQRRHVVALDCQFHRLRTLPLLQNTRRHRDGMMNIWIPYGSHATVKHT